MSSNGGITATGREPPGQGIIECMDTTWVSSLARRVRNVVSEMNYASTRVTELMLCYGLAESDRAPDTYTEFLLRTAGTTRHEPPARRRAAGPPGQVAVSAAQGGGGPAGPHWVTAASIRRR